MFDVPTEIARYLDDVQAAGRSPATVRAYRQRLARLADWLDGRPITRATLKDYRSALQADGLAAVTIAGYLRDVATFCRWLVDEGRLAANPATRLAPKLEQLQPASYSVAQIRRLLDGADVRTRAIVVVLLDTGLRASELVSLRRDRIDWETGHTTVVGKGRKERPVFLGPPARDALRAYLDTRDDDEPTLFVGVRGPLTANGVHQLVKHRAVAAGIRPDVRRLLHSFRATFAREYVQRGGDLESLRRLLGHSSIAMSAYYAQLADDELGARKAAVNPLAAVWTPDPV